MFASVGPKELPMATPFACLYMTLLKLNLTDFWLRLLILWKLLLKIDRVAVDHCRECQYRFG